MTRFSIFLFLLVPILGVATFVAAPWLHSWLPEDVSEHGKVIDHLFYLILVITGIVFVGCEVALYWFMRKYRRGHNELPVVYSHGSHTLEMIWTAIPTVILLFITWYQMNPWADAKMVSHRPDVAPLVEITGRQFEWRVRYPGNDKRFHTLDDILYVNEFHVPINEDIVVNIKSEDVLHSLFIPEIRLKQDIVPGLFQQVWFKAVKEGTYEIACTELCGWGHYKMRGRLVVESREKYEAWLAALYAAQEATTQKQENKAKAEEEEDEG